MGNVFFRFKQFTVFHDRCAMKVGTDGVLLGAWCRVPAAGRMLDIGTGTGLIALMVAQRSSENVRIDGVEIDSEACLQAEENISRSRWKDRIRIHCSGFNEFSVSAKHRYDSIVSNPPYFENSLLPDEMTRMKARHTGSLTYESLLSGAAGLLNPGGTITLIFPADLSVSVIALAMRNGLWIRRKLWIKAKPDALPKRVMIEWGREQTGYTEDTLVIEEQPSKYTPGYIGLTKDFYLKM